jgi:hypothetical protein
MKRSNFALRLQPSLMDDLRKAAAAEGVPLNQFINVAVAEKVSALRTEAFFRTRAERANVEQAIQFLSRVGKGNPPIPGDELPPDVEDEAKRAKQPRRANSSVQRSRKKRRA